VWDRICGTWRSPESVYDEIPADVHPPHLVLSRIEGTRAWAARQANKER